MAVVLNDLLSELALGRPAELAQDEEALRLQLNSDLIARGSENAENMRLANLRDMGGTFLGGMRGAYQSGSAGDAADMILEGIQNKDAATEQYGRQRLAQIQQDQQALAEGGPGDVGQAWDNGRMSDYIAQSLGNAAASLGPQVAAALLTRGAARPFGAAASKIAPTAVGAGTGYGMNRDEVIGNMLQDPAAWERAQQDPRMAQSLLYQGALASTALDVGPGAIATGITGRLGRQAAKRTAGAFPTVLSNAATEGLTEGVQGISARTTADRIAGEDLGTALSDNLYVSPDDVIGGALGGGGISTAGHVLTSGVNAAQGFVEDNAIKAADAASQATKGFLNNNPTLKAGLKTAWDVAAATPNIAKIGISEGAAQTNVLLKQMGLPEITPETFDRTSALFRALGEAPDGDAARNVLKTFYAERGETAPQQLGREYLEKITINMPAEDRAKLLSNKKLIGKVGTTLDLANILRLRAVSAGDMESLTLANNALNGVVSLVDNTPESRALRSEITSRVLRQAGEDIGNAVVGGFMDATEKVVGALGHAADAVGDAGIGLAANIARPSEGKKNIQGMSNEAKVRFANALIQYLPSNSTNIATAMKQAEFVNKVPALLAAYARSEDPKASAAINAFLDQAYGAGKTGAERKKAVFKLFDAAVGAKHSLARPYVDQVKAIKTAVGDVDQSAAEKGMSFLEYAMTDKARDAVAKSPTGIRGVAQTLDNVVAAMTEAAEGNKEHDLRKLAVSLRQMRGLFEGGKRGFESVIEYYNPGINRTALNELTQARNEENTIQQSLRQEREARDYITPSDEVDFDPNESYRKPNEDVRKYIPVGVNGNPSYAFHPAKGKMDKYTRAAVKAGGRFISGSEYFRTLKLEGVARSKRADLDQQDRSTDEAFYLKSAKAAMREAINNKLRTSHEKLAAGVEGEADGYTLEDLEGEIEGLLARYKALDEALIRYEAGDPKYADRLRVTVANTDPAAAQNIDYATDEDLKAYSKYNNDHPGAKFRIWFKNGKNTVISARSIARYKKHKMSGEGNTRFSSRFISTLGDILSRPGVDRVEVSAKQSAEDKTDWRPLTLDGDKFLNIPPDAWLLEPNEAKGTPALTFGAVFGKAREMFVGPRTQQETNEKKKRIEKGARRAEATAAYKNALGLVNDHIYDVIFKDESFPIRVDTGGKIPKLDEADDVNYERALDDAEFESSAERSVGKLQAADKLWDIASTLDTDEIRKHLQNVLNRYPPKNTVLQRVSKATNGNAEAIKRADKQYDQNYNVLKAAVEDKDTFNRAISWAVKNITETAFSLLDSVDAAYAKQAGVEAIIRDSIGANQERDDMISNAYYSGGTFSLANFLAAEEKSASQRGGAFRKRVKQNRAVFERIMDLRNTYGGAKSLEGRPAGMFAEAQAALNALGEDRKRVVLTKVKSEVNPVKGNPRVNLDENDRVIPPVEAGSKHEPAPGYEGQLPLSPARKRKSTRPSARLKAHVEAFDGGGPRNKGRVLPDRPAPFSRLPDYKPFSEGEERKADNMSEQAHRFAVKIDEGDHAKIGDLTKRGSYARIIQLARKKYHRAVSTLNAAALGPEETGVLSEKTGRSPAVIARAERMKAVKQAKRDIPRALASMARAVEMLDAPADGRENYTVDDFLRLEGDAKGAMGLNEAHANKKSKVKGSTAPANGAEKAEGQDAADAWAKRLGKPPADPFVAPSKALIFALGKMQPLLRRVSAKSGYDADAITQNLVNINYTNIDTALYTFLAALPDMSVSRINKEMRIKERKLNNPKKAALHKVLRAELDAAQAELNARKDGKARTEYVKPFNKDDYMREVLALLPLGKIREYVNIGVEKKFDDKPSTDAARIAKEKYEAQVEFLEGVAATSRILSGNSASGEDVWRAVNLAIKLDREDRLQQITRALAPAFGLNPEGDTDTSVAKTKKAREIAGLYEEKIFAASEKLAAAEDALEEKYSAANSREVRKAKAALEALQFKRDTAIAEGVKRVRAPSKKDTAEDRAAQRLNDIRALREGRKEAVKRGGTAEEAPAVKAIPPVERTAGPQKVGVTKVNADIPEGVEKLLKFFELDEVFDNRNARLHVRPKLIATANLLNELITVDDLRALKAQADVDTIAGKNPYEAAEADDLFGLYEAQTRQEIYARRKLLPDLLNKRAGGDFKAALERVEVGAPIDVVIEEENLREVWAKDRRERMRTGAHNKKPELTVGPDGRLETDLMRRVRIADEKRSGEQKGPQKTDSKASVEQAVKQFAETKAASAPTELPAGFTRAANGDVFYGPNTKKGWEKDLIWADKELAKANPSPYAEGRKQKAEQALAAFASLEGRSAKKSLTPAGKPPAGGPILSVTPEEAQERLDELVAMRGDKIKLTVDETVAMLGGSGEYTLHKKLGRLVRLAVDAMHPSLTIRHEALHDLWATLSKSPKIRRLKRRVEKYASSPIVMQRVVHSLAKMEATPGTAEYEEALQKYARAIHADPEEGVAYLFQQYTIDPEIKRLVAGHLDAPTTLLGKLVQPFVKAGGAIANFLRGVAGVVSEDQQVDNILAGLWGGKFSNVDIQDNAFLRDAGQTIGDKLEGALGPVHNAASKIVNTGLDRVQDMGLPALTALADQIRIPMGDSRGGSDFVSERQYLQNTYLSLFNKVLSAIPEKRQEAMLHTLQSRAPSTDEDVMVVRMLFERLHGAARNAGIDLGKIENYFPTTWDTKAIAENRDAFSALLQKHGEMSAAEAEHVIDGMIASGGGSDLAENENHYNYVAPMGAMRKRKLKFINENNANEFAKFQVKDMEYIVEKYVSELAHRMSFAQHFGDKGEVIEKAFEDAKKQGATPEELEEAKKAVQGALGVLPSPALTENVRTGIAWTMTALNTALLPLSLLSQMMDPLIVAARSGDVMDAGRAYMQALRGLRKTIMRDKSKNEVEEMADMLGVIETDLANQALGHIVRTPRGGLRTISKGYFKLNGMQGFNNAMRIAATGAGMRYIRKAVDNNDGAALSELGLNPASITRTADGGLDFRTNPQMKRALSRYVESSVVRPDNVHQPTWMNDPTWALLAHMRRFTYAFSNTALRRAWTQVGQGNLKPMSFLLAGIPAMIAVDMAKWSLTGMGPNTSTWGIMDFIKHGVNRAGLAGQMAAYTSLVPGAGFFAHKPEFGPGLELGGKLLGGDFGGALKMTVPGLRYAG